ncbi:MAG: CRISPR-associated protein Cas4 [Nitrospinae bacterium]|nr:CRISPR-associated protein Cas4 [Nitrospinota bacterium]MBF0634182.1 CRISPR-associated protein Cas4 [Nitrospinota bacterium]
MTPKFDEAEIVMISALEHYVYCPRQCALIHIDQVFDENIFTLRGRMEHERTDEPESSIEYGVRVERAVPLWSDRLGLIGKSDVVEFHDHTPYPVEYKHGAKRRKTHDDVQLCAQAMCLEEMLNIAVPRGAIFHHSSRRRREVELTPELRAETERVITETRQLLLDGVLPPPVNDSRCENCSLRPACVPEIVEIGKGALRNLFVPAEPRER